MDDVLSPPTPPVAGSRQAKAAVVMRMRLSHATKRNHRLPYRATRDSEYARRASAPLLPAFFILHPSIKVQEFCDVTFIMAGAPITFMNCDLAMLSLNVEEVHYTVIVLFP